MSGAAVRGRRGRRLWWQAAVVSAAGTVAVLLAQQTSGAVFTAQTGNGTDSVTTAASFCASPGSTTLNPIADTAGYQANPTTNYGTNTSIGTISAVGANARSFLTFNLPGLGSFCTITSATLKLYANTISSPVRTINVYRVDPTSTAWTEAGLTWNNQPPAAGTPVTGSSPSAVGWQQWTVTGLTQLLYSAGNHGFLLMDSAEGSATSYSVLYDSKEATNKPQLLLTWG